MITTLNTCRRRGSVQRRREVSERRRVHGGQVHMQVQGWLLPQRLFRRWRLEAFAVVVYFLCY